MDVLQYNIEQIGIRNIIPVRSAAGADNQTWEFKTYPGFNIVNHRTDETDIDAVLNGVLTFGSQEELAAC